MFRKIYARWMYEWETRLTTRDENRVVRPLEWGFEWIEPFLREHGFEEALPGPEIAGDPALAEAAMVMINQFLIRHSDTFFSYKRPTDFRLEERHPELFPTNVRPETLAQAAAIRQQAAEGKIPPAQFLRFTSPERTPYPENDLANARWYPAPEHKDPRRPKQAIVVMPQWNADAFSHNSLCTMFNKMGISALRLSKPYHDIRRPVELERSDYAVSANIGRTISACRQAVVDIRCCLDWLEEQGYEHFGVLGTSLGSCYAFLASAHDARLRVNAFNHASTAFGDVTWAGQSTRHVKQALEDAGLNQERVRALWAAVSPCSYYQKIMRPEVGGPDKKALLVYADYDLTFPREYSMQVLEAFRRIGLNFERRVLPCGHYTTGETPYKYIDGWYMGWFVYRAFKSLREEKAAGLSAEAVRYPKRFNLPKKRQFRAKKSSGHQTKTKGIEIRDLTIGTGTEATKESVVVANVREFLRRGDEVSHSPLFGTRQVIDLRRRECIAGLRYGIPGMRVGGVREIVISPHLAYGEAGIPGRVPANALLRCEVELLEIREHRGLLPDDWLPGKILMLRRCQDTDDDKSGWTFTVHESGSSSLSFFQTIPNKQQLWSQVPILLTAEESSNLIRHAMDLPNQMAEDCAAWDSGFIDMWKGGTVIRDSRTGARCMVVQVMEGGKNLYIFGVHEDSRKFLESAFYRKIEQLIRPHLDCDAAGASA